MQYSIIIDYLGVWCAEDELPGALHLLGKFSTTELSSQTDTPLLSTVAMVCSRSPKHSES